MKDLQKIGITLLTVVVAVWVADLVNQAFSVTDQIVAMFQ